jgi:hypothetical protein
MAHLGATCLAASGATVQKHEDQEQVRPVEGVSTLRADSFEAEWHKLWQSLDDEQDLVFGTAAFALVQQLQASYTEAHTATSAGPFDFLVDQQPFEITPKLQLIDQRREEILEQWDEVLERRQRRQCLERHGLTEIE